MKMDEIAHAEHQGTRLVKEEVIDRHKIFSKYELPVNCKTNT